MSFVRVVLAVPLFQYFDYLLPAEMQVVVGGRVLVPFGQQKRVAIVIELLEQSVIPAEQLKSIIASLDEQSLFSPSLWRLCHWASSYYQYPLGEVLFQTLPVKLRQGESAVEKGKTFWKLTALGEQALQQHELKRTPKQLDALTALTQMPLEKGNNPFSSAIWSRLVAQNYVQEHWQSSEVITWQQRLQGKNIVNQSNRLRLNKSQALALSQLIFQQGYRAWLLDGVTGSGKTEIYLQFIEEILKKDQQVLILVPEIGLTPQTVQRFRARFNVAIDVLHSNLNETERLAVWQRARTGQSAVVIGTRSALFTPFAQLGLIVIDEEHDNSFKQQEGWRYHARDLSVFYAHLLNIPILLGSATPSFESLNNVAKGKYHQLVLSEKAQNSTALQQQLIDLKQQQIHSGLSAQLLRKIQWHLQQGNQVLLFLNRRGFAPVLLCHECGWIAECQHCNKPYTYHQQQRVLRCHHCAMQKPIPSQCVSCGSTHLVTTGVGTEQLEKVLQQHFPTYQIARIDRDSTARKGKLESYLQQIEQGEAQILIGTQMLAKGHHFPNVTLVALVDVDAALFSLDFRAEERLAQLYVQVAGRAGRAEKQGEVVLQTYYPEHPLLQLLLSQGYSAFARQALQLRQQLGLPPFTAQALFHAKYRDSEQAEQCLQQIYDYFARQPACDLQLLGPMPSPMTKKAGQFRWQLLLQHPSRLKLHQYLNAFHQHFSLSSKVRWSLDIDPFDLN